MDKTRLFIISGPASVGKTTVSRILASLAEEETAIVDGDDIARFKTQDDKKTAKMFAKNTRSLIKNFLDEDIDVIFSHSISFKEALDLAKEFKKFEEVKIIFLKADLKTLSLRNRTRSMDDQEHADLKDEVKRFEKLEVDSKYVLDTTHLGLTETAKTILSEERFIVD